MSLTSLKRHDPKQGHPKDLDAPETTPAVVEHVADDLAPDAAAAAARMEEERVRRIAEQTLNELHTLRNDITALMQNIEDRRADLVTQLQDYAKAATTAIAAADLIRKGINQVKLQFPPVKNVTPTDGH